MRKVVLLTLDFPPSAGGVQQYLFEISRRIGRHCQLTVVAPNASSSVATQEPFQFEPVSTTTPASFWRATAKLHPDVIIVGHAHPRLLIPARRARCRYLVIAHGNDFESAQQRWHAPLFNHLLSRARPLVTNSNANAQRLRALGLPDPVIIQPGTDPKRFAPPVDPRSGPPVLLTVGRLVPRKGVDTVLRALPQLLNHHPDLEYWIAGDGPHRSHLQGMAQELDVTRAVTFLGFVNDDDLPDLYQRAWIFVMPASTDRGAGDVEGFGIVYLEAAASALPVVAARGGGTADAVRRGETGLLVPPNDADALAQALLHLLDDPATCAQMGHAGRRWVESEMNWDRAAAQFLEILGLAC